MSQYDYLIKDLTKGLKLLKLLGEISFFTMFYEKSSLEQKLRIKLQQFIDSLDENENDGGKR